MNNIIITGYFSRNFESAKEAAVFTNSKAYSNIEDLIKDCDTIFITTPDDKINEVWQNIKNYTIKGKIICHTSGSFSSKIFSQINLSGAFGYSIHPIFPFSDKFTSHSKLNNAYFSIEGHKKHIDFLRKFFMDLGNKVISIDSNKKPLYHLANVTVSNLVLSLFDIGCDYLKLCDVPRKDAKDALLPLICSNIQNIKENDFMDALTGPIERGDVNTIQKHINVLNENNKELYKILSLNLLKIAKDKNKERDYSELEKLLEES
ncbi:Rossmann-like and DUF2520 domain-containing protein [Clostridium sediminicola]